MAPPYLAELLLAFHAAGGRPLAQAATVSPAGAPQVRTVVLRGLGASGDVWFASDARSEKMTALALTPRLELCLFDASAGVQWRVAGSAGVHRHDGLAERVWGELSGDSRALFFSPPPGLALGHTGGSSPAAPARVAHGQERGGRPPASFAVVRLAPERCERLRLGPPLARRRWTRGWNGWQAEDVVP